MQGKTKCARKRILKRNNGCRSIHGGAGSITGICK